MRNVPLVLIRDPARLVIATAIVYALGLAVGWLISVGLLASQDSVVQGLDILMIAIIVAGMLRYLPPNIYRVVFPASARALRAMGLDQWENAITFHRQHYAEIERRGWLERLRTPLFLDTLKYSWRASALINLAFCQTKTGDLRAAAETYERCLSLDPDNVIALSALNLINLFSGGVARPANDLIERYLFDPAEQQRFAWITFGLEAAGVCAFLNAGSRLFNAADASFFWAVLILALGLAAALRLYRWAARRLFLADLYQGVRHIHRGEHQQALIAFQSQYYVLEGNLWLDRFRAVALLSPTTYSFREMALLFQVAPAVQLGDAARVETLTRECLRLNPLNVFAHTRLELIDAARRMARAETHAQDSE